MPPPLNRAGLSLLATQYGSIGRRQAVRLGNTEKQLDGQLRRGSLERIHMSVYRQPGAPVPPEQVPMAAVLRCYPDAVATGPAVLGLLRLSGFSASDAFQIVVSQDRVVRNVPFTVRRIDLPAEEVTTVGPIPTVVPLRALLDTAAMVPVERLLAAVDSLRWARLWNEQRLLALMDAHPRHPGTSVLRGLMRDGVLQQESGGERTLATMLDGVVADLDWQVWIAPDIRAPCVPGHRVPGRGDP